ncbi:hypothetical protein AB432_010110 [Brevibacillus brevis]|uniref:Uncharacterized protein n=1 Tax=Brevibacillus brevis TaxID=1393 RepID=A0A2Z4MFR6_BREBE|nr:hypothetical protein AB432_010110 [Brevibacillus brevis]
MHDELVEVFDSLYSAIVYSPATPTFKTKFITITVIYLLKMCLNKISGEGVIYGSNHFRC